ncbi:anti-sigma factor antagonist, partial [Mycobacterium avium]|uniref:anti-sigma factor antagonist n=1 Tax=Mycobacterium avium TaxID=1764 RepID=UPI001EE732A8
MNSVIVEPMSATHLTLSTKLVYELGDPNSTLRATTARSGSAVLIYAGGEIDACNEDTWRHLVSEAAGVVATPGPFVVDVTGLEFMGCCAFAVLTDEAKRCRQRGVDRGVDRQDVRQPARVDNAADDRFAAHQPQVDA